MFVLRLYEMGRSGYRHLKAHEQLTCEAAAPLSEKIPGLTSLASEAGLLAARVIATELCGLVANRLPVSENEQKKLSEMSKDLSGGQPDLHSVFLALEEMLDNHSSDSLEPWCAEDLGQELQVALESCKEDL
jgi:hypothetical protein